MRRAACKSNGCIENAPRSPRPLALRPLGEFWQPQAFATRQGAIVRAVFMTVLLPSVKACMIKSWIFEQLNIASDENPLHFDASLCSDEYAWRSETWTQAESQGFHGIFFSEHHFSGARACPAPGLLAASVAARTRRLRIGVLGWVLPMWHPWRLLEEIGVLDQLSQGRLEIGVARGSNPREAVAVGIGEDDIAPMYCEALDIIEQALHSPGLSHRGRYWSFDNLLIVPRPLQQPAPPIWATVRSPDAAAEAARRGHKVCTGFLPTAQIVQLFDAYRQAAERAGRAESREQLAIRRCIFVADSRAHALAHAKAAQAQMPSILDEDIISGSPDDVGEQIRAQLHATGAGNIVGFFAGHRQDRDAVQTSYRLFGEQVIPALNAAPA
ncbi:LLM class flavin-dependent oxidoreductase [Xanthomonas translucens]|uniref:LLM class flavin-dependent oxidoreductase n=2 Tax=Xanthomonas campestris pv. translucens TaxID=343 RepID=UPI001E45FC3B|nr:LLM class flavin-dependent oxidoreductase [Xanthomonas translucens]MCT8271380.1 LLM class flavin-dependent oxidoreductase [Xanthomonas translucens pv. undulosa]MCT8280566.1 LLM class flavin-dependent oxidoreductase [Xanthomonas translucens pv. undulosa]MCT8315378.1 LLM class flavin-dependent oxidoreductase [Xanthomonas translucens pv. undulosa]UJB15039.1 LLM class flavin-dependent oxidoreductase [Xanthomonas translucens pv. undulosa]UPU49621.1 LLM class flavin-dependent oxidoreductase [Xant